MPLQTKADLFAPELARLSRWAKALSHPARLQILQVLAASGTCICGDLVEQLPLAQASVSRHLKALKEAGLIEGEIEGPRTCYWLNAERVAELRHLMIDFLVDLPEVESSGSCC